MTEGSPRTRRQLASSFGAVADDYERARPGYPEDAVRWVTSGHPQAVLDVAAGTGKLTSQLFHLGNSVVALEPSLGMLTRLGEAYPNIAGVAGRAETLPFRPHSFDLVTAAQAFHWFDQPVAVAEFARVLRPKGRVGLLWNLRDDSVCWVAELSQLIGSEGNGNEDWMDAFSAHASFSPLERRSFWFEQPLDRDLLIALVRSRSYVATLPQSQQDVLLARVARLCEEHPSLSGRPRFTMPYRTEAFRTETLA